MENDTVEKQQLKSRCSFCSIVFTVSVGVVATVVLLCDQYSTDWLRYFDQLASNIKVPL